MAGNGEEIKAGNARHGRGQEVDKNPSEEYIRVAREAIQAVAQKEKAGIR